MRRPCEHCPWRISNHGKRTPWGFYTKANLKRLWHQIRTGGRGEGGRQSCHPTDPSHPDHIAAGAKAGAEAQECPGSVILVFREFEKLQACGNGVITPEAITVYQRQHRDGLTKSGLQYWLIMRYQFGGVPLIGGPKIPEVDMTEEGIGRL